MPQLAGTVQAAPANSLGFDTDTVVSQSVAQAFAKQGYRFCVRYLSLGTSEAAGDLTNQEAINILGGGLALMPVQHVANQGWTPSAALGSTNGSNAANNAFSVGFPPGVNVWLDLEGIASGTPAVNVTDYCVNWFNAVLAAGFVPGLYVGANCILSGTQLYDLPFQHYWQSESSVPAIPNRGYQMVQTPVSGDVNGISIDQDVTNVDNEGGVPQWLAPK